MGINMVEYLKEAGRPYPYILVLGEGEACHQAFVIFAGRALEQRTLLGALDICFKTFYVLDINYPKECSHVWELLQSAIYKMEGATAPAVTFMVTQLAIE